MHAFVFWKQGKQGEQGELGGQTEASGVLGVFFSAGPSGPSRVGGGKRVEVRRLGSFTLSKRCASSVSMGLGSNTTAKICSAVFLFAQESAGE